MTMADDDASSIVDWAWTARRLRRTLLGLSVVVVASFIVLSAARGAVDPRLLAELVGLALLVAFAIEVVVVGGAALKGMLAAGERGERLASQDVGLLPPQVLRRARGQSGCGPTGCSVAGHDHGAATERSADG
ncbi:MAG: hypothetical protein R6V28_04180 [Nitriliruptoraceae bacterium]